MNAIAWLEFELAYFMAVVQHFIHDTMEIQPLKYQVFLSNANDLYPVVLFQVFMSNTNNSNTIIVTKNYFYLILIISTVI